MSRDTKILREMQISNAEWTQLHVKKYISSSSRTLIQLLLFTTDLTHAILSTNAVDTFELPIWVLITYIFAQNILKKIIEYSSIHSVETSLIKAFQLHNFFSLSQIIKIADTTDTRSTTHILIYRTKIQHMIYAVCRYNMDTRDPIQSCEYLI